MYYSIKHNYFCIEEFQRRMISSGQLLKAVSVDEDDVLDY